MGLGVGVGRGVAIGVGIGREWLTGVGVGLTFAFGIGEGVGVARRSGMVKKRGLISNPPVNQSRQPWRKDHKYHC